MLKLLAFSGLSIPLLILSRRSLSSLRHHGFFRFFVWECVLWLLVSNYRFLIVHPFDIQRLISSLLMMGSLVLVLWAYINFRKIGQASNLRRDSTLFGFEKTTELVTSGVYRYIRHPMYGSLLFLAWGLLLRRVDAALTIVALASTCATILAAWIEEKENIDYFGDRYKVYRLHSKMFIPFVF